MIRKKLEKVCQKKFEVKCQISSGIVGEKLSEKIGKSLKIDSVMKLFWCKLISVKELIL